MDYNTQKAKGLAALKFSFAPDMNLFHVPPFEVFQANKVNPLRLVGFFVRPCPTLPRHGFVESRYIGTEAEAIEIVQETLSADPNGELILMRKINTEYNTIWTPNSLTIGVGNDGATSGRDALTLPTIGKIIRDQTLAEAEIENSPYLEVVYEGRNPCFVQLRDGPLTPSETDFIPKETTVKDVITAEGGLLEWEIKVRESCSNGTVVWHPGGALSSHYSVHAILKGLPVIISHKPVVGEVLKPNAASNPINIDEATFGFDLAVNDVLSWPDAVNGMLMVCRHSAIWSGSHDRLIGYGLGCAYRLTTSITLEHKKGTDVFNESYSSSNWNETVSLNERFNEALKELVEGPSSGFTWYSAFHHASLIFDEVKEGNMVEALQSLNRLVHAFHVDRWLFSKFSSDVNLIRESAECPAYILIKTAPLLHKVSRANKENY